MSIIDKIPMLYGYDSKDMLMMKQALDSHKSYMAKQNNRQFVEKKSKMPIHNKRPRTRGKRR